MRLYEDCQQTGDDLVIKCTSATQAQEIIKAISKALVASWGDDPRPNPYVIAPEPKSVPHY